MTIKGSELAPGKYAGKYAGKCIGKRKGGVQDWSCIRAYREGEVSAQPVRGRPSASEKQEQPREFWTPGEVRSGE